MDDYVTEEFTCPMCGHDEFLAGPRGGMAVNFCCAKCFRRFNDTKIAGIHEHGFVDESERDLFTGSYTPEGY